LARALGELRSGEFINEQPTAGDSEYVFKHALTQEVGYNSLLIERREQLHERVGRALESLFSEQLDDHLTDLAHHYSHSDNGDKVSEYLGRAGLQAMQRSAYANAIASLTAAIDALQIFPDGSERVQRELQLQVALARALSPVKGWASREVERSWIRAQQLCERLGNPPGVFIGRRWPVRRLFCERKDASGPRSCRRAATASAGLRQACAADASSLGSGISLL
jgi:predicted ATPase